MPQLRIASFNIRLGIASDGENAWPLRTSAAAKTILDLQADVVGLQEAYKFQLDDLTALLPDFQSLGVGREDGNQKGEYSALLVRHGRLEVQSWGTFWFSEEPDLPGSISWEADCTRSCTWAKLMDRAQGRELLVMNTHWDHKSALARRKSAEMLAARIPVDQPVVAMGDLNAGPEEPEIRRLLEGEHPRLQDATPGICPNGSWHAFTGVGDGPRIDHILISTDFKVRACGAMEQQVNGRWPSDHFPIWSEIEWQTES